MASQVSKLHKLLKPFLLRRIKSDVEDSLPAKQEILLYADMTKEQKKINEQLCDRSFIVSCSCGSSPHRGTAAPCEVSLSSSVAGTNSAGTRCCA